MVGLSSSVTLATEREDDRNHTNAIQFTISHQCPEKAEQVCPEKADQVRITKVASLNTV